MIGFLGFISWALAQGNKKNSIHNRELHCVPDRSIKSRPCPPVVERLFRAALQSSSYFLPPSFENHFYAAFCFQVNYLFCIES